MRITGLADPTNDQDAATKKYVGFNAQVNADYTVNYVHWKL
jgi:hypothetical protein